MSPWVDARIEPIDDLAERLDAQTHRRYLKTHSPGDCTPFDKDCHYIVVYRDPRDTLVSWGNHRAKMRPQIVELINAAASSQGVAPVTLTFDGDYDELFVEWEQACSPARHLASWWPRRFEPNVLFVHYVDLLLDLEHEMRRIANFADFAVEDSHWAQVVARCRLDKMRAQADAHGGMDRAFEGGAGAFFNQGVNGRWQGILTDTQIDRVTALMATLDPEAAAWLEHGSTGLGIRPEATGTPKASTAEDSRRHAVFGQLAKQQSVNSLQAFAERRVEQAREEGLFDDLPLQGKPLPDVDRQRPHGWWAERFVKNERHQVKALELDEDLRKAMPALWRLKTEAEVRSRIEVLNQMVDDYNRVTTLSPKDRMPVDETLATWRRLRSC